MKSPCFRWVFARAGRVFRWAFESDVPVKRARCAAMTHPVADRRPLATCAFRATKGDAALTVMVVSRMLDAVLPEAIELHRREVRLMFGSMSGRSCERGAIFSRWAAARKKGGCHGGADGGGRDGSDPGGPSGP